MTVQYGREVTGFTEDEAGVVVQLVEGQSVRAAYLVGCDGGRSLVRKMAGIEFPGWDPTISNLIAEVQMTGEPELGVRRDAHGIHALSRSRTAAVRRGGHGAARGQLRTDLQDLSGALVAVYGTDYGVRNPTWISRFTDVTRQAATYRKGRVLLAGDAAHVIRPTVGRAFRPVCRTP